LLEERGEGILMRPAIAAPLDVEIYTPERLAEFFLNNVMDKDGYLEARKDVEKMGIDPDTIDHIHWPDYSGIRVDVSRNHRSQVDATTSERRPCTQLTRTQ
jgi:hypothetical protein